MANPIMLAIAAIVSAAVAIWVHWEPIKGFFVDLWASISSGARAAWQAVTGWIGFDPLAVLSKGWSAIAGFVTAAWDAIPPLTWDSVITTLDWLTWVHPLRWLDLIPGFSWAGVISGALDWGNYIVSLDWTQYLPSFSWPDLPSFSWPDIPALSLPALPDIAGWIGGFGDRALTAIEGVSARLGSAWAKVKSAFSFGEATANVSVTDPATIQAAASATAGLRADMERVSAIDTTAAMDRLSALQRSAADVLTAVTSSVQRAQSFMASVSFYDQGAALMDTMAAGIRARAQVAVAEIARVAQMMRDHLPSSPAKVGPLSDIHRLKFGETIAQSIRPDPMVKAMRAAAAATMGAAAVTAPAVATAATGADAVRAQVASAAVQSASASGSGGSMTLEYKPTVTLPPGTPETLKADFAKMLDDHSRHIAKLMDEEDRRRGRTKV